MVSNKDLLATLAVLVAAIGVAGLIMGTDKGRKIAKQRKGKSARLAAELQQAIEVVEAKMAAIKRTLPPAKRRPVRMQPQIQETLLKFNLRALKSPFLICA
ncbi:hypothetical protein [Flaviaesturariibacter amylovorans]|uniref:YtxH domain-containing protein n=1 Tax=Flaviaesturariibacter amylovorans TaxID=1084520 RepID=A0ABP8H5G7_9BACT